VRFDFALLADYAQVVDGKLYVQGGGLTRLTAPSVPGMQPLAICMRLEPAPNDDLTRERQLGLTVLGPDDALITEHRTPLMLHRPDADVAEGEPLGVLVALMLSGLVVQAYGPHRVRLSVDEAEAELRFAVVALAT
jgi:hypothetical protein